MGLFKSKKQKIMEQIHLLINADIMNTLIFLLILLLLSLL